MDTSRILELPVRVWEKGEISIIMSFIDDNGVARTPTSASWTLSKVDGTIVNSREDVTINSPTSGETVVLSGSDTAILDDLNAEERIFTLKWVYGGITTYEPVKFFVDNLVTVS